MEVGNLRDAATSGGFWMAWLLLIPALLIPSPVASFFLAFLSVTCAILPLAFGNRKQRIGAMIALVLGGLLALSLVNKAKNDPYYNRYRSATQKSN